MLKFGDIGNNVLTLVVIFGLGYIIYLKAKQKGTDFPFRNLFSRGKEILQNKINLKK